MANLYYDGQRGGFYSQEAADGIFTGPCPCGKNSAQPAHRPQPVAVISAALQTSGCLLGV